MRIGNDDYAVGVFLRPPHVCFRFRRWSAILSLGSRDYSSVSVDAVWRLGLEVRRAAPPDPGPYLTHDRADD